MKKIDKKTVVRFAPSPTGHLHIGGARTALFNYLFAKSRGGDFILRIEDTDRERSLKSMSDEIIEGLSWLGLKWDSGPIFQSERAGLYKKYANLLLKKELAYKCFCTKDEIKKRSLSGNRRVSYKYDRFCLNSENTKQALNENKPYTIRFRVPDGHTEFKDRIHKKLKINNEEIEDFVLVRSDGSPTYQLSVVVDDIELGITDVIRGDDHISNTYKQILLFIALENKTPKYTHLPLVLGPDRRKLSKRHGEVSLLEFRKRGYLPGSLITYFSQLSWIPGDVNEIFSLDELVNKFSLEKVSKNSPIFDYEKLKFLNSIAIRNWEPEKIAECLFENYLDEDKFKNISKSQITDLIKLVKPRIKLITDFSEQFERFLFGNFSYKKEDIKTAGFSKSISVNLKKFSNNLNTSKDFSSSEIEKITRDTAEILNLEAKDLIHPSRYALLGMKVSPSIFDVFEFLGKEESILRINNFINYLNKNAFSD